MIQFTANQKGTALATVRKEGGWVIDRSDTIYVTQDQREAVDLIAPLVNDDRTRAESIAVKTDGKVLVISRQTVRHF